MHELAICQSLIAQLADIAAEHPHSRITVVYLQVGPLSGVEPGLLREAFPIASAGTPADGAELNFHPTTVRVRCPKCNTEQDSPNNELSCKICGNWQTELLGGDELILQRVELVNTEPAPATLH